MLQLFLSMLQLISIATINLQGDVVEETKPIVEERGTKRAREETVAEDLPALNISLFVPCLTTSTFYVFHVFQTLLHLMFFKENIDITTYKASESRGVHQPVARGHRRNHCFLRFP